VVHEEAVVSVRYVGFARGATGWHGILQGAFPAKTAFGTPTATPPQALTVSDAIPSATTALGVPRPWSPRFFGLSPVHALSAPEGNPSTCPHPDPVRLRLRSPLAYRTVHLGEPRSLPGLELDPGRSVKGRRLVQPSAGPGLSSFGDRLL
jgi:hypothetical protein